jgi:hypothetical protein
MKQADSISKVVMITAATIAITLTGCGKDHEARVMAPNPLNGDDSGTGAATFYGTWEVTERWDGCAGREYGYVLTFEQNGSLIYIDGYEATARVSGELLTWEVNEHSGPEAIYRSVTIWKESAGALRGVGSGVIGSGGSECHFKVELRGKPLRSRSTAVVGTTATEEEVAAGIFTGR